MKLNRPSNSSRKETRRQRKHAAATRMGGRPSLGRFRTARHEPLEQRSLLSVNVLGSFNAMTIDSNTAGLYTPPDATGAASSGTTYIETVNQQVTIYNKSSGATVATDNLNNFFFTTGGLAHADAESAVQDPGTTYDDQIGRFILSDVDYDFGAGHVSRFDFAVSKSSDPATLTTADWNFYQINTSENDGTPSGTFDADFPGNLGWNHDALVFTLNMFSVDGTSAHVEVNSVNISDLVNGVSQANLHDYRNDLADALYLRPAVMHDSKAGDPMWFVEEVDGKTTIEVYKMTNVLSNSASFFGTQLAVNPYTSIHASGVYPKQPNGTALTTYDDSRFLKAAEAGNLLVASQAVNVSPTENDARWYEIDVSSGTPVLKDQGNVSGGDNTYADYPAIDINSSGDIGMTYTQSGTDTSKDFWSMWVTGRAPSDPAGTMQTPQLVKAGTANYSDSNPNGMAGNMSGINVDSDGSFYAVSDYATSRASGNWGTAVAHFSVTAAGSGPPNAVYVNPAWSGFTSGQAISDADPVTAGNQGAVFGTTAFATVSAALAAVAPGGTVYVNSGDYSSEAVNLSGGDTLALLGIGPGVPGSVTFGSLTTAAGTTVDTGSVGSLDNTLKEGSLGTNMTVAGLISGPGNLTVQGGSLTLVDSGNSYSGGTTVSGGTLLVDGAAGSGTVTVASGAIVGGTGAIAGSLIVNSGGTVSPGDPTSGTGKLATGPLTLLGTYAAQINGAAAGANCDQIDVSGTSTLTGGSLSVSLGYAPSAGDTITLVSGTGAITGAVSVNGAVVHQGGHVFLSYGGLSYAFVASYAGNALTLKLDQSPTIDADSYGTGSNNSIRISTSGANTKVTVNGNTVLNEPAINLTGLTITAPTGNDTVTIDSSNGAVTTPIVFTGGTGNSTLSFVDSTNTGVLDTYTPGTSAGQGSNTLIFSSATNPVVESVQFSNATSVYDNVAGQVTVLGTSGNDTISYGEGSDATGGANTAWGQVTVNKLPAFNFTDKSNLTISTGLGTDTVNINNVHLPAGLASIMVNGGNPNNSDTLNFTGDGSGAVTVNLQANTVGEAGFAPVGFSGFGTLNVNAAGAAVNLVGTSGDDTLAVTPIDGSSATVEAQGTGPVFNLTGAASFVADLDGGNNTLVVNGSAGNDQITAQTQASGVPTVTVAKDGSIDLPIGFVAADLSTLDINSLAGNDTLTIDSSNGTITTPIVFDGGTGNNILSLTDSTHTGVLDTYTPGASAGQGSDTLNFGSVANPVVESVQFSNAGSIYDNVAGQVTVLGTSGNDNIGYGEGNDTTGAANTAWGQVTVNSLPAFNFSDKTGLTINTGLRTDTVNIGNVHAPAGLASITVNGGNPNNSDTLNFIGDGSGAVAVNLQANTVAEAGFAPVGFSGLGTLNINAAGAAVNLVGTAGDDTLAVTPTDANSATAQAQGTGPTFNFTGAASFVVDLGGGNNTLVVNGSAGNDQITAQAHASGDPTVTVAQGASVDLPIGYVAADLSALDINGLAGNDTLTVDSSNDAVTTPIVFDGGTGDNTLSLIDSTHTGVLDTYTPGASAGQGSDTLNFGSVANPVVESVQFSNAGTVYDNVAGQVTVLGTSGNDTIGYGEGSDTTGSANTAWGQVTVNNLPAFNFSGKTGLTINTGLGTDTVNIGNVKVPAGLASITVNGGNPNSSDTLNFTADGSGAVTVNLQANTVAEARFVPVGFSGFGTLNINAAGAAVNLVGTTGDETLAVTPIAANSATVQAQGTGPTINLTGAASFVADLGGGNNTLVVNGSAGNDQITAQTHASGNPTVTVAQGASVELPIGYVAADLSALDINGLAGNDTLTVDSSNGAVTTPIVFDGGTGNNTLSLIDSTHTGVLETYAPGVSVGQGSDTLNFGSAGKPVVESVQFSNAGSIYDNVAGQVTVLGTSGNDTIGYGEGSDTTGTANTAWGQVTINNLPAFNFSGKTGLTINTGLGTDTVHINNANAPTSLASITVNGGNPNNSDTLNFIGGGSGAVTINLQATTVAEAGFAPVGFSGFGTLNVDAAGAAINFAGTAGDDTLAVTPIDANSAMVQAQGTGPAFNLTGAASFVADLGGGSNTLIVNGSANNDQITAQTHASGDPTITVAQGASVDLPIGYVAADLSALDINGLAGNDTLAVDSSNGAVTTPIVFDGGTGNNILGLIDSTHTGVLDTYTPGASTDQGSSTLNFGSAASPVVESVQFSNAGSIYDNVAGQVTVLGTSGNDNVSYGEGSDTTGTANTAWGQVTVNSLPAFNFSGKTSLTINTGLGTDIVNINDVHVPAGLATITVKGGNPDNSDTLNFTADGGGAVTVNLQANTVAEAGFALVGFSGFGTLNVNAAGSAVNLVGAAGDNTLIVTPSGATSATAQAQGTGPAINFIAVTKLSVDVPAGEVKVGTTGSVAAFVADEATRTILLTADGAKLVPVLLLPDVQTVELDGVAGTNTFLVVPAPGLLSPGKTDIVGQPNFQTPVNLVVDVVGGGTAAHNTLTIANYDPATGKSSALDSKLYAAVDRESATSGVVRLFYDNGPASTNGTRQYPDVNYSDVGAVKAETVVGANGFSTETLANWVSDLYGQLLGRVPAIAELMFWINQLEAGEGFAQVAQMFVSSDEYRAIQINQWYETYLHREADSGGLAFWIGVWNANGGPELVQAGIIGSPEFYATAGRLYPNLSHDAAWVTALYHDLLNRDVDQAGLTAWVNFIQTHSRQSVVLGFLASDEYRLDLSNSLFETFLGRPLDHASGQSILQVMHRGFTRDDLLTMIVSSEEYVDKTS